ncbi:hypothetical protein D0C36_08080 [Mucilaginibacter conchicola]|uniref:Uncharacterized protein n=1 Tax=Mucilaginibacter conchicola TaxID=2303333 RepID=A0A372P0N9_9SPHI|nr:hypothetical protein [Mucilaginibacter conchicola]RFZ95469.1 hypothetical protein D0C36_08080 [Mucilaginibacter conchicola]
MKNKLRLAIVSLVIQFLYEVVMRRYPELFFTGDGFAAGGRMVLSVLSPLSTLGLLPFFIGLYKSKSFVAMMDEDEKSSTRNPKDDSWLKHLLIRIGVVFAIIAILFAASTLDSGMGSAFLVVYGIAYTLGIGSILLIIEAVVLFVRKSPYKASCNIFLIVIALTFLSSMM